MKSSVLSEKTRKTLSLALVAILVLNLILFGLQLYDALVFWLIIILSAVPAFTFLKKK